MSTLTLSFKGKILKTLSLREGEMIIGSDPGCEIHIDSLAVHPRHAKVITRAGAASIRDLGSEEGVYVNNDRVNERLLKEGDIVRVGKHNLAFAFLPTISLEEPELPKLAEEVPLPGASKPKSAWLQILSGQNLGKTISLNRSMTNLGKPGVQTAVIVRRNEGFFIAHLEGEHSPLVDGKPIGEHSCQLQDGQTIQMGNVKMQFYLQ